MAWGMIGASAVSLIGGKILNSGGGSSSGGGGSPNVYTPGGLGAADQGWQDVYGQQLNNMRNTANQVYPNYQNTFDRQGAINYNGVQEAADNAASQYGKNAANSQYWGDQYGNQARLAQGQQQNLYNAGNQTYQTALDPQNALYGRTAQRLQDQVRAGQAARGLGNSAYGAGLEDQAMGNFNMDWENQQLARQTQGLNAMNAASEAGQSQGRLMGASAAGNLSTMGAIPDYLMQQGQLPVSASQYLAGQPAANANQYAQNMGGMNSQYANIGSQAIPYMNYGTGAQQQQQQFNSQQNQAYGNLATQAIKGGIDSYNTPGSWLSNLPGGAGQQGQSANPWASMPVNSGGNGSNDFFPLTGSIFP